MSEPQREACKGCGRPALVETLAATGGYCRRCSPGEVLPRKADRQEQASPRGGAYEAQAGRVGVDPVTGEDLVLVFMPSLVALLLNREKAKGSQLTEPEVRAIRDKAPVVAMARSHADAIAVSRGYTDIDPAECWSEWLEVRRELLASGDY